jgi:hypothetical protein
MSEEERALLVAVAKWIEKQEYEPSMKKAFGPNPSEEAWDVHMALQNLLC